MAALMQVSMGMFDMAVHGAKDHDEVEGMDMSNVQRDSCRRLATRRTRDAMSGARVGASSKFFTHLMGSTMLDITATCCKFLSFYRQLELWFHIG